MPQSSQYSRLERWTHQLAFSHPVVQEVVADLQAAAHGSAWRDQPVTAPIFVTSLPRAGTTLLLELLARVDGVASNVYRDMPFPRAPILWGRLSGPFRRMAPASERAHGDGVMISPDSPEAFEEVLWLARFPAHFAPDGIAPWSEPDPVFTAELTDHMRRVLIARNGSLRHDARYLSKNNANIGRVPLLRSAFPNGRIVVPLRDPLAQSLSMHRQHMLFVDRHRRDPFSLRYMRDLGHFEFGALHRPILFDGMREVAARWRPERLEYWIGYWTVAFTHLARQDGIEFLDMARFCRNGRDAIQRLTGHLGLPCDSKALDAAGLQIRPLPDAEQWHPEPEGLTEARSVFEMLSERGI